MFGSSPFRRCSFRVRKIKRNQTKFGTMIRTLVNIHHCSSPSSTSRCYDQVHAWCLFQPCSRAHCCCRQPCCRQQHIVYPDSDLVFKISIEYTCCEPRRTNIVCWWTTTNVFTTVNRISIIKNVLFRFNKIRILLQLIGTVLHKVHWFAATFLLFLDLFVWLILFVP